MDYLEEQGIQPALFFIPQREEITCKSSCHPGHPQRQWAGQRIPDHHVLTLQWAASHLPAIQNLKSDLLADWLPSSNFYLLARFHIAQDFLHLLLVHLRTRSDKGQIQIFHLRPLFIVHIKGVSNCSLLGPFNTSLHKLVIDLQSEKGHYLTWFCTPLCQFVKTFGTKNKMQLSRMTSASTIILLPAQQHWPMLKKRPKWDASTAAAMSQSLAQQIYR